MITTLKCMHQLQASSKPDGVLFGVEQRGKIPLDNPNGTGTSFIGLIFGWSHSIVGVGAT